MKVMAGFTIVLSILGLVTSLHGSEDNVWYCAGLKLIMLILSFCGGVFAILFLIMY